MALVMEHTVYPIHRDRLNSTLTDCFGRGEGELCSSCGEPRRLHPLEIWVCGHALARHRRSSGGCERCPCLANFGSV